MLYWYVKCRVKGQSRYKWLGDRKLVSKKKYAFKHRSQRRAMSLAGIMLFLNNATYEFKVVRR